MTKNNLNIFKNLSLLSYIGIMMMVPIFGAVYLGNLLDQRLGTNHIFMIIFIILGVGAAFRNVYTIMMKSTKKKK